VDRVRSHTHPLRRRVRADDRLFSARAPHAPARPPTLTLAHSYTPYTHRSPEMLFRFYAAESTLTHRDDDGPCAAKGGARVGGFTAAGQKVRRMEGGEGGSDGAGRAHE